MKFLQEETCQNALKIDFQLQEVDSVELLSITSILTVEEPFSVQFAFSFDYVLIKKIFQVYSEGVEIDPGEEESYLDEAAADMINITVGNAIGKVSVKERIVDISTPMVISQGRTIARPEEARFYITQLSTQNGVLKIFCLSPKNCLTFA